MNSQKRRTSEIVLLVFCLSILTYFLWPLFTGETIMAHDNFYWNFPIFHYTATSLLQGVLPLWDPYTSGGQPFYPHLVQFRLLEPVVLLTIGIGKFFTQNTVILFNCSKIFQTLLMCLGAFLCLSRYAKSSFTRLFLIPVLLFSSFFLGTFHQDGILSQFVWVPWTLHFLLAIFFDRDLRWYRFLFLSVFIGLNWQSYQFAGTWTLLFFLLVGALAFERENLRGFLKEKGLKFKASASLALILLMMAPNLALISESSRFVFPLRMAPKDYKEILMNETGLLPTESGPADVQVGIKMPYEMIPYTGAMVKVWEIIQTFTPNANANIHSLRNPNTWGFPSEAFIYIGILPWAFALFGLLFGQSAHKKLWALFTFGFGLLMMGPPGGLHRVLFHIFPPLWFIRHTTLFVLFFVLGMLYFFTLGLEAIQERKLKFQVTTTQWSTLLPFGIVLFTFGVLATKLDYPVFKFPETNFLFVIFSVLGFAAWKTFPLLGKAGLWVAALLAQVALVLFLSPTRLEASLYLFAFLLVPLFLVSVARALKNRSQFIWSLILLLTTVDLLFSFWSAARLYAWQISPDKMFQNMKPAPLTLASREPYPDYPSAFYGRQAPRYLSLLHQKRYALSGALHFSGREQVQYPNTMAFGLEAKRWNSYLLLKSYFNLIHGEFNATVLAQAFQIGEPLLQFKSNAFPEASFSDLVKRGTGDRILENAVLVSEDKFIASTTSNLKVAEIETTEVNANRWAGTVKAAGHGYFLYGDSYDRYWNAKVDGKRTELLRLNLRSKGVSLSEGSHFVEFDYHPLPFLISVFIFLLIPALVVAGVAMHALFKWIKTNQKILIPATS